MTAKEVVTEALIVYTRHCATQITRKRNLKQTVPTWEQLKKIEEVRAVWRARFDNTMKVIVQIDKGELLGL